MATTVDGTEWALLALSADDDDEGGLKDKLEFAIKA